MTKTSTYSRWLLISMLGLGLPSGCVLAVGNDKAPTRTGEITTIVIHAIGGPICKDNQVAFTEAPGDAKRWKKWFEQQSGISIHYVVDRDGNVAHSIDEDKIAWHAKGNNKSSIGIELVNKGDGMEKYPEKQISALSDLVKKILGRHKEIEKRRIVRHSDIDSRKFECGERKIHLKQDPGPRFPYQDFISNLYSPHPLIDM